MTDLERATEIANKIASDGMLRQGSSVDTILKLIEDVRYETIEEFYKALHNNRAEVILHIANTIFEVTQETADKIWALKGGGE